MNYGGLVVVINYSVGASHPEQEAILTESSLDILTESSERILVEE